MGGRSWTTHPYGSVFETAFLLPLVFWLFWLAFYTLILFSAYPPDGRYADIPSYLHFLLALYAKLVCCFVPDIFFNLAHLWQIKCKPVLRVCDGVYLLSFLFWQGSAEVHPADLSIYFSATVSKSGGLHSFFLSELLCPLFSGTFPLDPLPVAFSCPFRARASKHMHRISVILCRTSKFQMRFSWTSKLCNILPLPA